MRSILSIIPFYVIFIIASSALYSQSVGINTATPDASAALEVDATNKGILIPRMSLTQRDNILNPAQGLLVFVQDDTSFYYFTGDLWLPLKANLLRGNAGGDYIAGTGIALNGNIINNASPDQPISLIGTGATTVTGIYPDFVISSSDETEDGDSDPSNELQTLTLQDNQLTLDRNGGSVELPSGLEYEAGEGIALLDNRIINTAPDQALTLTGDDGISVTGTYPDFNLISTDADHDPNNELQQLEIIGDSALALSGGDTVNLPRGSLWKENGTRIYYDVDHVGIKVKEPLAALHIAENTNVLWGDSLSGEGGKLIWFGQKSALRFGYLSNGFGGINYENFWNYDSVGFYSFAGGQNARAKGFGAFAWGNFGWADGSSSVAFFGRASGNGSFSFSGNAKGRGSFVVEGTAEKEGGIAMYGYTGGRYGVSIGGGATGLGGSSAREDYGVAIGWNADARGQASVSLGPNDAYGYNAFSTGWVTEARGNYAFTMGYRTIARSYAAIALGRFNLDTGDSARWVATDPIFTIGDGTATGRGQDEVISPSNSFTILKNGQTAIGYDTPVGRLQVKPMGTVNTQNGVDATRSAILIGDLGEGMAFDVNQIESINNPLHLNFSSVENISMGTGGGNVGIGEVFDARLDIKQTANETGGGIRLRDVQNDNNFWEIFYDTGGDLQFARDGLARASIDAATGAYLQLSDRRVKRTIHSLDAILPKILQLRPVSFQYTSQKFDAPSQIGFIAQEVVQLFPELVFQTQGYQSLLYDGFATLAIRAIQEQQQQIDELQTQLDTLKYTHNELLTQTIAQLEAQLQSLSTRLNEIEK